MEQERLIAPVADNRDKQRTYRENMRRYSQAMKYGFYLEAMFIDYAMLEDRLTSFLYHIGALDHRTDRKVCGRTRPQLKAIQGRMLQQEKPRLGVGTISGKCQILKSLLLWSREPEAAQSQDRYLQALYSCITERLDVDGLLDWLDKLENWKNYRNEVIHTLLNKNVESLEQELPTRAREGNELGRYLDRQIGHLKEGNVIRRSVRMKTQ